MASLTKEIQEAPRNDVMKTKLVRVTQYEERSGKVGRLANFGEKTP